MDNWEIKKLDYIDDSFGILKNIKQKRFEQEAKIMERPYLEIDKELYI